MRCPDCNKFVPFGDMNVDDVEFDLDEESGNVAVSGRISLPCEECGTDLKELSIDGEVEMEEEFDQKLEDLVPSAYQDDHTFIEKHMDVEYSWLSEPEASPTERSQNTITKTSKKGVVKTTTIKNPRYMKSFRGIEAEGEVKRVVVIHVEGQEDVVHESTAKFSFEQEEQASAFEDCC